MAHSSTKSLKVNVPQHLPKPKHCRSRSTAVRMPTHSTRQFAMAYSCPLKLQKNSKFQFTMKLLFVLGRRCLFGLHNANDKYFYSGNDRTAIVELAVTNAGFAALQGLPVALFPLDDARSASQTARSSRVAFATCRSSGGLPSAARRRDVPLRLRFVMRFSPPSAPLSPLADHRPKPEIRIRGKVMNSPISDWPISDFPITDCKIASHSACRRDNAMKPPLIVWRRRSRQGYYGSLA